MEPAGKKSKKDVPKEESSEEEVEEEEEEEEETLEKNPAVLDKHKTAARITQDVLKHVMKLCVAGADIADICLEGDKKIEEETVKVYTSKKSKVTEKGIAFPTCIGVNEICGHFSPLKDESRKLADGDLVKIDLGCHIDGFIAQVTHTMVVGATKEKKVTGKKADVIVATHKAFEAALRLLKEGNMNHQITKMISQISGAYKTNPVEGVLSHQVKKHMIDGDNVIINKETTDQKVEEHKFERYEVYVLDVILSTGEGKPKETDARTTVYKRALETAYSLKLKHSRQFFHTISEKHPTMPFSIASLKDATSARVGVMECINHDLLHMYPVLTEKAGEFVAQFKATVVLLPAGTMVINETPFEEELYETTYKIEDKAVLDLLAQSLDRKKDKKAAKAEKKEEKAPAATTAAPVEEAKK